VQPKNKHKFSPLENTEMDETEGTEETDCNGNFPMLCKLWLDLRNLFVNNQVSNMATVDSAVTDESTNSGPSTVVKTKKSCSKITPAKQKHSNHAVELWC
jgi:hypothetical protein